MRFGAAANAGCSPEKPLACFAIWGLCWCNSFLASLAASFHMNLHQIPFMQSLCCHEAARGLTCVEEKKLGPRPTTAGGLPL